MKPLRIFYEQEGTAGGTNPLPNDPAPQDPKYLSQLSPELRANPVWKEHETLNDLGQAYLSTRDKLSKAITIPGEGATEEEVSAFRERMGIPKAPDEYEIDTKGIPENVGKQLETLFRDNALKSGLTKEQAKKQWNLISGIVTKGDEAQKAQVESQKKTFNARLATSLEKEFPVKTERDEAANEMLALFNEHAERTGLKDIYESKGLSYDPSFVLAIAKDEKEHASGSPATGKNGTNPSVGTMGNYTKDFLEYAGQKR